VFKPLLPLFPTDAVDGFRHSGMFALSNPATLATALAAAGLTVQNDEDVDCRTAFDDVDAAVHAFMVAGPTALAIRHSGEAVVAAAAKAALGPVRRLRWERGAARLVPRRAGAGCLRMTRRRRPAEYTCAKGRG
jgi:hypothetical protein